MLFVGKSCKSFWGMTSVAPVYVSKVYIDIYIFSFFKVYTIFFYFLKIYHHRKYKSNYFFCQIQKLPRNFFIARKEMILFTFSCFFKLFRSNKALGPESRCALDFHHKRANLDGLQFLPD